MCSRYYVDEWTEKEIMRIARETGRKLAFPKTGDIHPSEAACVLAGNGDAIEAWSMNWGFQQYEGKGLFINARAESILERVTFKDSVIRRRCVIPAAGFYEWDREKTIASFRSEDSHVLYMAGIYKQFEGGSRFVVITTKANPSVSPVHDRMPLLFKEQEIEAWLDETAGLKTVKSMLLKCPGPLQCHQEYEQQRFSFL